MALGLASVAFAVNFWAWSLISPLAPRYAELLGLSPLAVSVLVAVPVIVGSLGRIPMGALTDRLGGRRVFSVLCFATVLPVVFLAFASSYPALLAGGLVLGLGGASFAVGVPFVNAWFPPERRGLALGLYGMGNAGTAVANFVAPALWDAGGQTAPYLVVAVALVVVGVLFWLLGRDAPGQHAVTEPLAARLRAALRLPVTVHLAALYAITFGGLVAFGVYLPSYLRTAYGMETSDAALRAAVFVLLATLTRPVGGTLADRVDPVRVIARSLAVVGVCAVVVAFTPALPLLTAAMLVMAGALGIGNGAIFALLGHRVPADHVGTVTGVVGAAGGLGGFLPPIVMGLIYQLTGSYSIGLMLLSDVAFAGLIFTLFGLDRGGPHAAGRGQTRAGG